MKVPESYQGREQAYVKHHLLTTYLERLFMIIGRYHNNIRYVDCFSGPWKEADENLKDTSIGLSLEIISKCQESLEKNGNNVRFQALFIEKDRNAFEKLNTFINAFSHPGVTTTAKNGNFYELRADILDWCGPSDFTFFFIDPKGWKNVIEIPTLEIFLKRPNSEFLINFMFDFLLRTHPQKSFQNDMRAIFGYIPDTTNLNPKEKEAYLINLYRSHLKKIVPKHGGTPRTSYVPIQYPLRDRTLYHLVYLTRHAKGIAVFMEASEKLELVQKKARAQAKQEHRESRTKQIEMFQPYLDIKVGERADLEEINRYWLNKLAINSRRFGIEELADIIEETGWFESELQESFGMLLKQGLVENIDDKSKRRYKKYVHFDADYNQGERLKRMIK